MYKRDEIPFHIASSSAKTLYGLDYYFREMFKEGSIQQIIFDYWNDPNMDEEDFRKKFNHITKVDLVDFIIECQAKGLFGNGFQHYALYGQYENRLGTPV